MLLKALYKCLLNSDGQGASKIFLGSLFQYLTSLRVKKIFLMSSPTLSWYAFDPFPHVLLLVSRNEPRHLPLCFLSSRSCRGLLFSRGCPPSLLSIYALQLHYLLCCSHLDVPKEVSNFFFEIMEPELHTIFKVRIYLC